MSTNQPARKRHPWEVMEGLLAEDEAARVEKLTDAELEAELRAEGIDPEKMPTVEELIARGKARAAKRAAAQGSGASHGNVLVLPVGAKKQGSPGAAAGPGAGPAPPRRLLWLAAAMFLVAAGGALFAERGAIVARFRKPPPPEIKRDDEPVESPAAGADRLIDEAAKACETHLFGICSRKLDEAVKLLPAGEDDPRVKALRETIDRAMHPPKRHEKEWWLDEAGPGRH